jgi:tetratricopeptide (TPR) repeat protein
MVPGKGEAAESLVYFESLHPYLNYHWAPVYGVTRGAYKLIHGPSPKLFDVITDPKETQDLWSRKVKEAEALLELFPPLAKRTRPPERIELSRGDRKRIENLGYAGSADASKAAGLLAPGELPEGLRDPEECLKLRNLTTEARKLAMSTSRGQLLKAVKLMKQVLKEDPHNPTFQGYAGSIYFRAGMHDEAIKVLRRSLKNLESASARETLASCYYKMGYVEDAVKLLKTNVELHPHDLMTRFKLGDALLRLGDAKAAMEHLDFFLKEHGVRDQLHKNAKALKKRAESMIR